eukprot:CAMPEP_0179055730 /NCGR_PEP_ID=MMETSP0796-20121207/23451_1 /TAXON_ID=73915 /ORGANISM="Pyrodinium bahamense, Strain pbaha01" /LENGTH=574 /DNA_ID=CAMNT_0020752391 /DNA_START=1 /DNA_END=1725 /DNA_ORIENTATION=-
MAIAGEAAGSAAAVATSSSPFEQRLIACAELFAPYVAEFFGTFFVVFTVGFNTISGDRMWMPTSIAFAIMVAMYATNAVSGGHLNPALSFAFGLARKLRWHRVWGYMVMQFAAGLAAGFATTALLDKPVMVGPKDGFNWLDSMIVEGVYSSMFCFVALNCMASLRNNPRYEKNQFFALAVGFVSIAGGHTTEQISGAFFNPAMTLGFGLTNGTVEQRFWTLLYAGYQFAGAVVATTLFFMVRPEELAALGIVGEGLSCGRACGALSLCSARDKPDEVEAQRLGEEAKLEAPLAPYPARVLSEFIGTYVVVFTVGLSTAMLSTQIHAAKASKAQQPSAVLVSEAERLAGSPEAVISSAVAWSAGAAVLCMVYSLANISGGHFNPAVTLAVMCTSNFGGPGRRRCALFQGLSYILVQAGAAIAAAISCACVHRGDTLNRARVADLGPKSGYSWHCVGIGETVFTLAVALSVLCTTTVKDPRYPKAPSTKGFQFALAIGMCVTAGGFALEGITGGLLNPAVSLGVSVGNVISSGWEIGSRASLCTYYVLYQMLGGFLASVVFRAAHPLEYKEDPLLL